ncbi:MAG TPA: glycine--tRNA ligase subunit beta [Holophagaceae bacterium]|jgi:glycyl-tRNA synthetase beta chain|nr:glycine--tRNA ligase subunit beta [Holophagaceae bacterium]
METRTFLLELHCEEIPARFLQPLADEFKTALTSKLEGIEVQSQYSPRKLAWFSSMSGMQADQTETQVGPPQRMCVGEDGQPTIQGLKFAEKWGVDFSAVRFEQPAGKKEICAVVTVTKKGRPTKELLAEALPGLIAGLHVPKAMRWGSSDFEFVRPIRNVLCLFGDEVVDFTVDGVKSRSTTWGHRLYHRQHPEPILVKQPEDYDAALKAAGIVVSFSDRRAEMGKQLHALASEVNGRVVADDHLLDTLAEIVEVPKIVRGDFPTDFLDLPKEVLVTSLREHQKAFCIEDANGKLLPHFFTAANRTDDPKGFVKSGNEWVLKARLYDARFFFAEDRKHKLETRLDALKHLTFQRELGSYFDKTQRVMQLAERLAGLLGLDAGHAKEASRLAKCDLRTLMVGEFPELQGVMGGEYLMREGAPAPVWEAVKEHYQPAGADDALPASELGALLSIADKLDTVAGCFAVGLIPSGSKDPLALRRAGQGVIRILWERGWKSDLADLAKSALTVIGVKATKPETETLGALAAFFSDRVSYQLEQAGYAGAVRRSALAVGGSDLVGLKARCEALSAFADDPRFASLAQSAKRIANILKDEMPSDAFDAAALQDPSEKTLAALLQKLEATKDHKALLAELAELAQPLAAFFDAVMVKADDPKLRAARLSLLHRLRQAFLRVADFSQWQ